VSGVVGRADVLACLLFLLTFYFYIRSVDEWVSEDSFPSTVSPGSLLISLFLGTCAMLVKETGITVFAVCLLYDALVLCRDPLTNSACFCLEAADLENLSDTHKTFLVAVFLISCN
ncbi:Protein O-mannosyl-transferase tmtc1, partial [Characodon lateralis]|nr:Protein O-mannosyl-transferase tmtc1 [Characodon lateralis]